MSATSLAQLAEQAMRKALDGTFTRIVQNKTVTERVPLDHIPKHVVTGGGSCKGVKRLTYARWTPELDEILLAFVASGVPQPAIATAMNRGPDSIRHRLSKLRGKTNRKDDDECLDLD